VLVNRPGAFERAGWPVEDWDTAWNKLTVPEQADARRWMSWA